MNFLKTDYDVFVNTSDIQTITIVNASDPNHADLWFTVAGKNVKVLEDELERDKLERGVDRLIQYIATPSQQLAWVPVRQLILNA